MTSNPGQLGPGALLRNGAYRVEALLKVESGMGELYRALHVSTGVSRAIKRLKRFASSPEEAQEDLRLFEREAQGLAGLSHPGIPRVYDSFGEDGAFFFSMDWIDGVNAEQLVEREGQLTAERCIDLATQLAEVLAYIHKHEPPLIHRDIKPANLMVTSTQRAMLVDFGIARRGGRSLEGRRDTVLIATEDYAPPEQLDQTRGRTTPRSDVYSFGWTFVHLITGRRPGKEGLPKDQEPLLTHALEQAAPDRAWFTNILLRCTRMDPKDRFADGAELVAALYRGEHERDEPPKGAAARARCAICPADLMRGRYLCASCGTPTFQVAPGAEDRVVYKVAKKLVTPPVEQVTRYANAVRRRQVLPPLLAELSTSVARLDCTGDFDILLSEHRLRFRPLPHQLEAAKDVLRRKRGRALLADEVGLGKTIEALMILEEYRLRGLVRNVLILTPPTLVAQWQDEIVQKLGISQDEIYIIPVSGQADSVRRQLKDHSIAIGDIRDLRNKNRAPILDGLQFDMVIVDEVHLILSTQRNKTRPIPLRGYELIQSIQKKFVLLLSATPIQNTIVDLYELVNLTRPGQLLTWEDFKNEFIEGYETRSDGTRFPVISRGPQLRKLLQEVVVRHRRDEVMTTGVFPRREARMIRVDLQPAERKLYDELRQRLATSTERPHQPTWCLDVADALSAHPEAFAERGKAMPALADLVTRARELPVISKLEALVKCVDELVRGGRKVLVFSRFATARDVIARRLVQARHRTLVFHKGICDTERVSMLRRFSSEADILVVDDSAAVGLNLQFCDVVVNYDLPWNPFLIEQRVGRVQRIGQRRPSVWIVNFMIKDTIDEVKLDLCTARLRMFEGVFGQSPTILGALDEDADFDLSRVLREIYLERDAHQVRERVRKLCQTVDSARERLAEESSRADHVFQEINWSGDS